MLGLAPGEHARSWSDRVGEVLWAMVEGDARTYVQCESALLYVSKHQPCFSASRSRSCHSDSCIITSRAVPSGVALSRMPVQHSSVSCVARYQRSVNAVSTQGRGSPVLHDICNKFEVANVAQRCAPCASTHYTLVCSTQARRQECKVTLKCTVASRTGAIGEWKLPGGQNGGLTVNVYGSVSVKPVSVKPHRILSDLTCLTCFLSPLRSQPRPCQYQSDRGAIGTIPLVA